MLACAAALAFDNFGLATIQAESMQGDDEFEGRACTNGSLFCELMRLQAADADNIVMKVRSSTNGAPIKTSFVA